MLIQPLDLSALSDEQIEGYRQFLPKLYWQALKGKDPWGISTGIIDAVSAVDSGAPKGLAISSYYPNADFADLLSLDVDRSIFSVDILEQLIRAIQGLLKERKCKFVSYLYLKNQPLSDHIEDLLKKDGWSTPRQLLVRCHFYLKDFYPSWVSRPFKVPSGCKILPWKDIPIEEAERIVTSFQRGNIQHGYSPFEEGMSILQINSVVLMDKTDRVVGWMICHLIAHDTVKYTSLFLEKEYRSTGAFLALLQASIHLQQETAIPKAILEVNVEQVDSGWIQFVKKRLLPESYLVERYNLSSKNLFKNF